MAATIGENALIYINNDAVPLANEWSIDIDAETIEAPKTFVCPPSEASSWVTKSRGYKSASGSISALYDAADTNHIDYTLDQVSAYSIELYPDCAASTKYWMGDAFLSMSMSTPVDGYVTVDYSWESTGAWDWKSS